MKMTRVVIVLVTVLLFSMCRGSPDCDSFTDCVSCTRHESWSGDTCRWCPLDKECHAYASLVNSCRENENIKHPSLCNKNSNGVYSPDLAFLYTQLSAVAYSDSPQKCADDIFPNSGFELVTFVGRRCEDLPLFKYKECFAYTAISHVKRTILLAYRGTDFTSGDKQIYDEILSVLTIPKTPFMIGGEVQDYFENAHNKLYSCVKESIAPLVRTYPDYDVTVIGHSLGAAMASLSAASLVYENIVKTGKIALYAFGMPRVGDKEYALQHDKIVNNSWRVVHLRDIVSHLPTCNLALGCKVTATGPYHHGIEIYYPYSDMNVDSPFIKCNSDEDDSCSDGAVTDNWCVPFVDLDTCIEYHKVYFGIAVGTICDGRKMRFRRYSSSNDSISDTNRSDMWDLFSSETCRSINPDQLAESYISLNTTSELKSNMTMCGLLLWVMIFSKFGK